MLIMVWVLVMDGSVLVLVDSSGRSPGGSGGL